MKTLQNMLKIGSLTLAIFAANVSALDQDTLVVGISRYNAIPGDTFRVLDPNGNLIASPWSGPDYMQSVEFDNANGIMHNPNGNLLAANFGNSYTGFEVYALSTDGSDSAVSLWGIKALSGAAGLERTDRGGGLSVSPDNNYIAWASNDTGNLWVLDYDDYALTVTGSLETNLGNGYGSSGSFTALKTGATQGTTWLDNDTVLTFNGFGELIALDVTTVGTGSAYPPNRTAAWRIVENSQFLNAGNTDVYYNADINPDVIYGVANEYNGTTSTNTLFAWNASTFALIKTLDVSSVQSAREMAFDYQGNLYFSTYAGSGSDDLVACFAGGADLANWTPAIVSTNLSIVLIDTTYAPYTGLDVACGAGVASIPGDYNNDGSVDLADYTVWADNFGQTGSGIAGDGNNDGTVDLADYTIWADHFGQTR